MPLSANRRDTVRLGSAFRAHESQRFGVTRIAAWNCPCLGTLKTDSWVPTGRSGENKAGLCFARFVFLTFRGPLASQDSNPYPNRSRIARYNATKFGKCYQTNSKSFQIGNGIGNFPKVIPRNYELVTSGPRLHGQDLRAVQTSISNFHWVWINYRSVSVSVLFSLSSS